jgi:hypothetical protein
MPIINYQYYKLKQCKRAPVHQHKTKYKVPASTGTWYINAKADKIEYQYQYQDYL